MLFGPQDLFEKKEIEVLNEEQIIRFKNHPKYDPFSVDLVAETNRNHGGKDAYFKYTPKYDNYKSGTHETRISIRDAYYVRHTDGKPHHNLIKDEIKILMIELMKPHKNLDILQDGNIYCINLMKHVIPHIWKI